MDDVQHLPLVVAIIAAVVVLDLAVGWFRRRPVKPYRERVLGPLQRAATRSSQVERRLAKMHVVDDTWSEVRIVPRKRP